NSSVASMAGTDSFAAFEPSYSARTVTAGLRTTSSGPISMFDVARRSVSVRSSCARAARGAIAAIANKRNPMIHHLACPRMAFLPGGTYEAGRRPVKQTRGAPIVPGLFRTIMLKTGHVRAVVQRVAEARVEVE